MFEITSRLPSLRPVFIVLLCGALLPTLLWAQSEPTAEYRITFEATWSAATHAAPSNPHFSPLIGGTHNGGVDFWTPGTLASEAIEVMAQAGRTDLLRAEMQAAMMMGSGGEVIEGMDIPSPGVDQDTFLATMAHPLATVVTMVAPSPDWFVGVDALPLRVNGQWIEGRTVDLFTWDAGTDSGTDFRSPNQSTRPPQPIALLGAPLDNGVPMGRFVFERLDAPDVPPLELGGGDFRITARWQIADGTFGTGRGSGLTADTGTFWFFDPDNVELVVKVLDACAVNGHRWVFAGGLTSVGVELEIEEVETGTTRTYENPIDTPFQPVQDTRAFPCS